MKEEILPDATLTPPCTDTNWLYSVSTNDTSINIGDYVTINPTNHQITIKAKNIYGNYIPLGNYPVTVRYSLISGLFTNFTFNLNINTTLSDSLD